MQNVASSKKQIIVLILLTGAIALLHFIIPTDRHDFHILHIVLRKLYFLPPVIAAAWYGLKGSAYVTLAISILFSLHAFWIGRKLHGTSQSERGTRQLLGCRAGDWLAL